MDALRDDALNQLFLTARTYASWLPQDVSDDLLKEIYDLMKWGPTSANLGPLRILFIKNGPEKERLLTCVMPMNADKVRSAPVTAIFAFDQTFYNHVEKLLPVNVAMRDYFASDKTLADTTAFRNSSLQAAYFMLAARARGLDCGPMSGFDNQKLDEEFFNATTWKSNFICNLGYGDKEKLYPRLPRLNFEEACKII